MPRRRAATSESADTRRLPWSAGLPATWAKRATSRLLSLYLFLFLSVCLSLSLSLSVSLSLPLSLARSLSLSL